MAPRDDCPKGGWTSQTLYEHFTRLREADQLALQRALEAMDKRLMGMNEFRASVQDISNKMMPRDEANARFNGIEDKLDNEVKRGNLGEGKSSGFDQIWTILASAAATIISIWAVLKP